MSFRRNIIKISILLIIAGLLALCAIPAPPWETPPVFGYSSYNLILTCKKPFQGTTPAVVRGEVTGIKFTVSPQLPSGLSINDTTGEIKGTPDSLLVQKNFKVTATNAYGNGETYVNITILPAAPVPFSTPTTTETSALIRWSKVAQSDSFKVFRSSDSTQGFVRIASKTDTFFLDNNLTSGDTLYYTIQCFALGLESTPSDTIAAYLKGVAKVLHRPIFRNSALSMSIPLGGMDSTAVPLVADDADGDSVSYSIDTAKSNVPSGSIMTLTASKKVKVSIPTNASTTQAYSVLAKASDTTGQYDTVRISISVYNLASEDTLPPVITSDPSNQVNGTAQASDSVILKYFIVDNSGLSKVVYVNSTRSNTDSIPLLHTTGNAYELHAQLVHGANLFKIIAIDNSPKKKVAQTSTTIIWNRAPLFARNAISKSVVEGQTLSLALADSCKDPDIGDALSFSLLSSGNQIGSIVGTNYQYVSTYHDAGQYTVYLAGTDGTLSDTLTLSLTVTNVNRPPQFITSPGLRLTIPQGKTDSTAYPLLAIDTVDNDVVTLAIDTAKSKLPTGAQAVLLASKRVSIAVPANAVPDSTYSVLVKASDLGNAFDTLRIKLTVFDPTAADTIKPTIDADPSNPASGAVLSDSTVQLRFTIQDFSGIYRAGYIRADAPADSHITAGSLGNYVFSVTLKHGSNSIKVFAIDNSANKNRQIFTSFLIYNRKPSLVLMQPVNAAQAISRNAVFSYKAIDLDNDSITYSFYLGIMSTQLEKISQSRDTFAIPNSALVSGQQYFWRVFAFDGWTTDSSIIRSFTANNPPQVMPKFPSNGAIGIGESSMLNWEGSDPDLSDINNLHYDVYLAQKDSVFTRIAKDIISTSTNFSNLRLNSQYKWKIVVKDGKDSAESPIYTFTSLIPSVKLKSLQLLNVTFSPNFDPLNKSYAVSLLYPTDSLTILAVPEDSLSAVTVNSQAVSGGRAIVKNLRVGLDTIAIKIISRDGLTNDTYFVIATRAKPITFERFFGQLDNDAATDIVQTSDSGYIIGGNNGEFARLVRITSTGELSWTKQYGVSNNANAARRIVQAANGHFVVLAQYVDTDVYKPHLTLFECDGAGNVMWQKNFSCFGYDYEYARTLVKTNDGGYLIGANAISDANQKAFAWIIKTTAAGALEWDSTYTGLNNTNINTCATLLDGSYLLGGTLREAGNGNDSAWVFKVDKNGKRVWSRTYPEFYNGSITGLVTSNDGSIFVCGGFMGQNYVANAYITKLSSNGNVVKTTKFEGSIVYRNLSSIKLMNDGNLAVSGWTSLNSNWDGWLLKVTPNCDTLWTRRYGSPGNDFFNNVTVTNDGGFILAGYLYNSGMWVIKSDRDGLIW